MTGHVHKWVVEQICAAHLNDRLLGIDVHVEVAVAKLNQVGKGSFQVGVPVATTVVFEHSNLVSW